MGVFTCQNATLLEISCHGSYDILPIRYNLNRTWYDSFKTVISDDSARGVLLSDDEVNIVLNTLADDGSKAVLNKFLTRWNNTGIC